jgi:predicted AlkP superfamily phosphohydrolase/phosphomutase
MDKINSSIKFILFIIAFWSLISCKKERPIQPKKETARFIIIGFDGVEPSWLEEWSKQGFLPNISDFIRQGSYTKLGTTNPPQSPVAWASFATGLKPEDHGIFDFIRRNPATYLPEIGTIIIKTPEIGPPLAKNLRLGPPFWKLVADKGIKATVLYVPYAFPPDYLNQGKMLSGLGVPDLRGTNSTFIYFDSSLTQKEPIKHVPGGLIQKIELSGQNASGIIQGPKIGKKRTSLIIHFKQEKKSKTLTITIQDKKISAKAKKWTDWIEIEFIKPKKIKAIFKLYIQETYPQIKVYMSPLNYHPEAPYIAFTYPRDFARRLMKKHGLFKTLGWAYDTSALNQSSLKEISFLQDMYQTMKKRKEIILNQLNKNNWQLFIGVFTATDRVAHMFYRLIDPLHPGYDPKLKKKLGNVILKIYQEMDKIVGKIRKRLRPKDILLIISDHGFHSYRRGFHINSWLCKHGYLRLKGGKRYSSKGFLLEVDWKKTKAYALGTGQIYINLKGREKKGIVSKGKEYTTLIQEIKRGLISLIDKTTGIKPIQKVFFRDIDLPHIKERVPDLQIAFKDGYRTSWESVLGGIPQGIFADNTKKWSGDHSASDPAETKGIIISTQKITKKDPHLIDIAPTVFKFFKIKPKRRLPGRPLF